MNQDTEGTEYNDLQKQALYYRLKDWITTTENKIFAQKVFRIYVKCLLKNKTKVAITISEKYKQQIENMNGEEKDFIFKYYYHYLNGLLK